VRRYNEALTEVASKAYFCNFKAEHTRAMADMRRAEHTEALRANLDTRLAAAAEKRDFMAAAGVIMAGGGPCPVKEMEEAPWYDMEMQMAMAMQTSSPSSQVRRSLRGGASAPVSPAGGNFKSKSSPPPPSSPASQVRRSAMSAGGIRRSAFASPIRRSAVAGLGRGSSPADRPTTPGSFAPDKLSLVCN
jgi:hypothetical protein